ncbi:retrovirus-related pol polyprotein from transposon TNT 1-94 [Tanacetum coccineum]
MTILGAMWVMEITVVVDIKQHYKELYDSIKLTRAKIIEKTTSLLTEIETLTAQIKGKTKCVTMPDPVKPKVLAPSMYAIDVEPIPPRNRNNREVHIEYLKHLKESVRTLREIVEEARVENPLDSSLATACLYTKHSQELLEYVIGTCPKDFNKRDRKIATAPLNRKKQVPFMEPIETSTNNSQTHVEQQKMKKTNDLMIPSTGIKDVTAASGSKPRSNTKKDRTLPAESDMKKVEAHSRNNKSSVKQNNRVDSSISFKRTFVKKSPVNKPTGRKFTLGEQCPLTRLAESKVVPAKQPESVSTSKIMITERLSNTSHKPLTRNLTEIEDPAYQTLHICLFSNAGRTDRPLVFGLRFGNDHFGAIMGYGDYVISDSVIFRVYYVEGLGHNIFSVRQFCDSDLEVAFRKHSCYASKNKSWLWHRRLNHLNFGTINDLARKDLVRGLPILKFEKDHLCSACQLGKSQKYSHKPKSENTNLEVLNTLHMDLCGPIEDLGKLRPTTDIGIFVGYAPNRKGYRIYNKRTQRIMETIHVQFDELTEPMAPVHISTGPEPILLTPGQISSGLVPDHVPVTPYVPPTNKDLKILFQPMFYEYFKPPGVERPVPPAPAVQVPVVSTGVAAGPTIEDNPFAQTDNDPFVNMFAPEPSSDESSSGDVSYVESTQVVHPHTHLEKWSKDHPLDNVIDIPSHLVSTRKQQMPCGAITILYCQKLNKKMLRLVWMKLAGLKLCKKKFTNLIDFKYENKF